MKCEHCNKNHNGTYGSGRFCSRACANARIISNEIKLKISNTIKLKNNTKLFHCTGCGIRIRKNKTGYCLKCLHKTNEYKIQHSKLCKGKVGGFRNINGGTTSKHGWYKGIWCDSSWELAFVIYNLENNIKFKRNNIGFEYIYDNEKHKYYPDFILEDGSYVEIKGYKTKQFDEKQKQFKDKLIIIDKEKIQPYIKYVEEKYGKDFIKFYESIV